jgi:hypothetical protein
MLLFAGWGRSRPHQWRDAIGRAHHRSSDFANVSPVGGVLLGGGRQRLEVAVDVDVAAGTL